MQMSPDCWIATTKSTDADPQSNRESNDDSIPHGSARYAFCARTGPPRQTRSGKKKFAISTQNCALARRLMVIGSNDVIWWTDRGLSRGHHAGGVWTRRTTK